MAGVALQGLSKVFPNGIEAVSMVDLTVADGEVLAVVGPSGSGKSTLLRMIAGLETPTAGSVWIAGRDVTALDPRERDLAVVFQQSSVYPHLSVFENLAFGLRARKVAPAELKATVAEVARSLGLTDLLDRRPDTLSGGQQQRVALGRAVARRPAVFLFDEPLSSLDTPLRAAIRAELLDLQQKLEATMIYVTHEQAEALGMGGRVAVMRGGRLLQVGSPREVYTRPATAFVAEFLGSPPMNLVRCSVDRTDGLTRLSSSPPNSGPFLTMSDAPIASRNVIFGIRPEHLRLTQEPKTSEDSTLWTRGEVGRLEYLGDHSLATIRIGAVKLTARLTSDSHLKAGESVSVGVPLERIYWFDDETGEALEIGTR